MTSESEPGGHTRDDEVGRVVPGDDDESRGHGWWPYLLPYVSFMFMGEIISRLPESSAPAWFKFACWR